jgi:hypothetical protein
LASVTDTKASETVDLRERPQHHDRVSGLCILLDPVRVVRIVDVFEVRLVQHGQDVPGHGLEVRVELGPTDHRARGIVRVAEVDELRALGHCAEQRLRVVPMLPQRHLPDNGAELQRVEHVARKRRPAADDLVAGIEAREREVHHDSVRAGGRGDVPRVDSVTFGQGLAQAVEAPVRVAIQVADAARQSVGRGRERPVRPLVRRELDDTLEPQLAPHVAGRLSGLVGHDPFERRLEEGLGDAGQRAVLHARTLSGPGRLLCRHR